MANLLLLGALPIHLRKKCADGLPRHLLEETHQVVRLGEMQAESDFLDGEVSEEQVVLHLLQEALFQQMHRREAELAHHRLVERHAADAHHLGIVRHPHLVADVLLQELLVLVGVVVQRQVER